MNTTIPEKTVFFVAAGSGGHILPALRLADKHIPTEQVLFFTGTSELEKKILSNRPELSQVIHWPLRKFSLRQWWFIPLILVQFIVLFCKSIFYCAWYRPETVISTGGMLSLPLSLAACLTGRNVEIYELNVIPGKAVKALLPFATTIHHVFPQTRTYCHWGPINFASKCHDVAYPLRFTEDDKLVDKHAVIEHINTMLTQRNLKNLFEPSRTTLFVIGGSQGSRLLNKMIKEFINHNPERINTLQIIHQIGGFEERSWEQWYEQQGIPALTFSYDDSIGQYYALADLIICRAGAGTLFEIAFFDKRCLVIPLVAATTDHQIHNAYAMAEQYPGLFTVLKQEMVVENPRVFFETVNALL